MLKESIKYGTTKIQTNNGNKLTVLFIDPKSSDYDLIYRKKDYLKDRFDIKWLANNKIWGWWLPIDSQKRQEKINTLIRPCIEYLNRLEDKGNPTETVDQKMDLITGLIAQTDKLINARIETNEDFGSLSAEGVKKKLADFKAALLKATTDEEFRQRFEPVLKQVISGGHQYSILNTLLIYLQDPQASTVYSLKKWNDRHRYVFDKKHPICLWSPLQDPVQVKMVTNAFLREIGKKSEAYLTQDEDRELHDRLRQIPVKSWTLRPNFYDIRYTNVMKGKEDLVQGDSKMMWINQKNGNENGDLKWFDKDTPADENSVMLYNAIIEAIKSMGITVEFVDNLGGARGISHGGTIEVLKNAPKNNGTCNTLIHELSHELFHHTQLRDIDKDKWGKFYVGRVSDKHIKEQQAELCSWIVMLFFGYTMDTNINYVGNWGLNEGNAAEIFDQVANAADTITRLVYDNYKTQMKTQELNESLNGGFKITGAYVASLLGQEALDLYNKSKQMKQSELEESRKAFNDSFNRICGMDLK